MGKGLQGFASMDRELHRNIASKGGKSAHAKGVAYKFTPEKARAAALRGHELGRAYVFTSEKAREAGRIGGLAAKALRAARRAGV